MRRPLLYPIVVATLMVVGLCYSVLYAQERLLVATASNALGVVRELARQYERLSGVEVEVVGGSTGKLYAQIVNGAPYHIFISADSLRPRLLEQKGLAVRGTRFTYAEGVLVLWLAEKATGIDSLEGLRAQHIGRIAIANPKTAPYGRAALEALRRAGLYESLKDRIVYGENVAQALGFALTGNADAAVVAKSALYRVDGGKVIPLGRALYSPIRQDAVLLKATPEAYGFFRFIRSDTAKEAFRRYGYRVPSF